MVECATVLCSKVEVIFVRGTKLNKISFTMYPFPKTLN